MRNATAPAPARHDPACSGLPFRTLLYRYLFYGWLFKDVNRGNLFERAQAWHHNRDQARWLPTYIRRWLVLGALWFAGGAALELGSSCTWLSACLYVPSAVTLPFCVVTAVCWLFLTHDRRPG